MFWKRLISGVLLVIGLLATGILGGNILLASLGMVSVVGMSELYRVLGIGKSLPAYGGYGIILLYYLSLKFTQDTMHPDFLLIAVITVLLFLAIYVFAFPKYHINQIIGGIFGVFYVGMMLSCIYLTRQQPMGIYYIWLIFLCSWGCDTCAYCVGVLMGKHKMAPVLSPKKSIEGAVGGILGTMLLTIIYSMIFQNGMGISATHIFVLTVICGIGAGISMIGDLAASAIKRNYHCKDYGNLIPGHGGVLDRFDSVLFTAPTIYFLILYFI